jgi:hypothetical protein
VRLTLIIAASLCAASARAVTISPPYAQLVPGQALTLTASPPGVVWQVDNVTGNGISAGGVYTAPATPPSLGAVTVTAVSTTHPSETATATITLLHAPLTGTVFYVAPSGSDTNPGTITAPFATLQHAASVAVAGDTVLARAGIYNKLLSLTKSGTAAAPITFASYPGETATIDGTGLAIPGGQWGLITLTNVSNVIVEGFELRNYTTASLADVPIGIYVTGAGTGVQVVNNHIHAITTTAHTTPSQCGSDALGLAIYGSSAPAAIENLFIGGNQLDHLLTGCSESLTVNGNVTNYAVVSNLIFDNDNIGIDSIGFEGVSPNPSYDQARNGEIRGNVVYNITSYGNPDYGNQYGADGIYVDGGTHIVIEQNLVHDTDLGIEMASETPGRLTSYITARNNVLYTNYSNGISIGGYDITRGGSDHITVVDNTLFEDDTKSTGSGEFQIQFHATNNVFENNVAYAGPQGLFVNNLAADEPHPAALDHNLYFLPAGAANASFYWLAKPYNGLTAYRKASLQDAHTAFVNPVFDSLSGFDLDVQSTSPAIGAAVDLGAATLGSVDFAGNPRIGAGSKVTQGAYQLPGPP